MRQDGVSSAAATSSAASSVIAVTSAVDRVHADVASCISDYLSLSDVARATSLSTVWRLGALQSMKRIDREAIILTDAQLASFIASPLRHHIKTLVYETYDLSYWTLASLLAATPRLLHLTACVNYLMDAAAIVPIPAHGLKSLEMTLIHSSIGGSSVSHLSMDDEVSTDDLESNAKHIVTAMQFVGHLTSLEKLTILTDISDADENAHPLPIGMLDPLLALTSLSKLWFTRPYGGSLFGPSYTRPDWQQRHFDVIRSLPQLTSLDMCEGEYLPHELEWLLRAPHQLRLSEVNLRYTTIDAAAAALIGGVPTLTKFEPWTISAPSLSFLSQLPLLKHVTLHCDESVDLASLITELHTRRPDLTSLELRHPLMTSAHLVAALPRMPKLERLELYRMPLLTDLAFVRASPQMATKLLTLAIHSCRALPSAALQSIKTLHALEIVSIYRSLTYPLTAIEHISFTPGTPEFAEMTQHAMPMLRAFVYEY